MKHFILSIITLLTLNLSTTGVRAELNTTTENTSPLEPSICSFSVNKGHIEYGKVLDAIDLFNVKTQIVLDKNYTNLTKSFISNIFNEKKAKPFLYMTIWTKDGLLLKYLVRNSDQWGGDSDTVAFVISAEENQFSILIDGTEYFMKSKLIRQPCKYGNDNTYWEDESPIALSFSEGIQQALSKTTDQSKVIVKCKVTIGNNVTTQSFDIGKKTLQAWKELK